MTQDRPIISVTAAILARDGKILFAQRKSSDHLAGKWEFPGGKIESGESPEHCLRRELQEEFGIDTKIGEFLADSVYQYDHISIRLLAYRTFLEHGKLEPNDHDAYAWVKIEEMDQYDFAPADVPFVDQLKGGQIEL
jgi:8-oxo-dGTP diphosphatase